MKRKFSALLAVIVLTIIDQVTKYFARLKLADGPFVIIKDVFTFTYLENTGGMWGSFHGKYLFLGICSIIVACGIIWFYLRIPSEKQYLPLRITMILLFSGAIGNFIDRIGFHYVTDFIYVNLIDFPIFNVADIYVTCAAFALIILVGFIYKDDDLTFLPFFSSKDRDDKKKE